MTINLSDVVGITLNGSSVVKIEDSLGTVLWEKNNNAEEYFYIENLTSSANTLSIKKNNSSAPTINVYRSTNKTTWTSIGSTSTTAITYSIPANSKIYLRATTDSWSTSGNYNSITCSGNFAVGGNIMSLLYGDSFIGKTVFPTSSQYNFSRLFSSQTNLKNIVNLVLPATTLTQGCYQFMFNGCTGLTSITRLPATTLANSCYSSMFSGTSITSIPLLPATTLTNYCYNNMFSGCTGITSIPSNLLPATTLTSSCYQGMFKGCTGLTSIPSTLLHSTTLSDSCYSSMFSGCTGLTSIPSNLLPATTLVSFCYGFMFQDCTGITSIPSNLLPATTLANYCYFDMFMNCTGLTKSPELPATTLYNQCYQNMFNGCSSLNEITCYANDISASNCTKDWVNGVSATGTFYKMGSAEWTLDSVDGVPTGWTVVERIDPINDYFYVENLTNNANTLSIKKNNSSSPTITVYYSTDKTTWVSMGDTDTTAITYSIPANSKVYLKATTNSWCTNMAGGSVRYNQITCSNDFGVGGNIMSLLYGDSFIGKTVFPTSSTYNLSRLFYSSTYLKNIDNLVLPAITLTNSCYRGMFSGTGITSIPSNFLPATNLAISCYYNMFGSCTGLTSIPSNFLPATTLANECYSNMFQGCTSLTTIPSNLLPATTLDIYCYYGMFMNCTGLTKSPELPATTLTDYCYYYMFYGCSSLNEITCYANDISASNCTSNWVKGVAASGTFNKKGTASWTTGTNGIPTGWTVDENSYSNEYFYVENRDNSSNTLSIQKTNASTTTLTVYYSTDKTNWYSLTTSTTKKNITIPANSRMYIKSTNFGWNQSPSSSADPMECRNVITWNGTSVSVGGNIMSLLYGDDFEDKTSFTPRGGSYCFHRFFKDLGFKLNNINNLVLPSVNLSSHCYDEMFKGCSSITSIPFGFLPAPTIPTQGYYQMFEDCTGLTSIPSNLLPAPRVTQTSSYCNMFKGCTGLTSIPSTLLPATEVGMTAYAGMFRGCTGLTTLPSNLLPATNLQYCYGCYQYMFADCTGLTSIPSNLLPATTLESQCYSNMFSGCTGLTKTPNLPATTLTEYCYSNMFSGCTNLEKVICYANDISASNCTNMWLYNVAGSGTFYKLGSASWTLDSDSGIPTGWTVETEYSE